MELKAENDALKAEVSQLRTENEQLKALVAELEALAVEDGVNISASIDQTYSFALTSASLPPPPGSYGKCSIQCLATSLRLHSHTPGWPCT